MSTHDYTARIEWTGNEGPGTKTYSGYKRTWSITTPNKPVVHCSNDPLLGGDPTLHNPEDLLLTTVSACHMLWYLHLASSAGIVVSSYSDSPVGTGESAPDGSGRFLSATLHPTIAVPQGTDLEKANAIHGEIHNCCYIARSVNFPISYDASFVEA